MTVIVPGSRLLDGRWRMAVKWGTPPPPVLFGKTFVFIGIGEGTLP
jgi:hypothetical protein